MMQKKQRYWQECEVIVMDKQDVVNGEKAIFKKGIYKIFVNPLYIYAESRYNTN